MLKNPAHAKIVEELLESIRAKSHAHHMSKKCKKCGQILCPVCDFQVIFCRGGDTTWSIDVCDSCVPNDPSKSFKTDMAAMPFISNTDHFTVCRLCNSAWCSINPGDMSVGAHICPDCARANTPGTVLKAKTVAESGDISDLLDEEVQIMYLIVISIKTNVDMTITAMTALENEMSARGITNPVHGVIK